MEAKKHPDDAILARLPHDLQVQIPKHASCIHALEVAYDVLPEPIFNHSLRVFLLAKWLSNKENTGYDSESNRPLLFVACICHDFGASDKYNGTQRFEVEGADAATSICDDHDYTTSQRQMIWTAIALHTSAGIAERIDPFTRLVRVAVKCDFSAWVCKMHGAQDHLSEIEEILPRLNIEKVLADSVVKQAKKIPERLDGVPWPPDSEKHPKASWPGILLRAHAENPDYEGVNPAF